MALKADSQGFLIGEVVSDLRRNNDQLNGIRADVRDIKSALLSAMNSGGKGSKNAKIDGGAKIAAPTSRRDNGANKVATPAMSKGASVLPPAPKKAATPNGRDASTGKFTAKSAAAGGDTPTPNIDDKKSQSIISNLANRITSTAAGAAAGAEEADPAIKAIKEVSEPMMRGYQTLFGGGDKKERWFKKIWKELNIFRKDETIFNKAEAKVLKNISEKPGGGGEESPGFLGGLMGSISPWVMTAITGIGGALLTGVTAVLGAIFSPIGLAIAAAGAVAWGLFTESGQKFFGEVGAKIIAGWEVVTTAFAPITESIGNGWKTVKGGFDSLINGMLSSWDTFTAFLKDKFGIDIPAILKPGIDAGKKAVEGAKETVKAGVDTAKDLGGKAADAVAKSSPKTTEALGNAWDKTKDGASKIASHATGKTAENKNALIKQMAESGITDPKEQAMFMAQMDHESGGFTHMEESFKYRSADKLMGISKSARELGKPAIESAMAQGPEAIAEAMYGGRMGNVNKGDAYAFRGRGLTQLTGRDNYTAAGKDLGLDLSNNPDLAAQPENAAKIAAWYWKKNKLGDSAKKGDVKTNRHGINGGEIGLEDVEKKFDKYLVAANNGEFNAGTTEVKAATEASPAVASIADDPTQVGRYKYETLEGGKVQVTDNQTGVMELASDEQANAYRKQQGQAYKNQVASINAMPSLNNLAAGPRNATQTAYAAAPKIPTFSPVSAPAEAPPIKQPLASNSDRTTTAAAPSIDVGQDIKDRNIAHIATGGFSGRG